ncbi:OPT-domain-containing protein [Armillaria mellea]|nr:OPT-domain-containing protein [Armillaria mellea]
MSADKKRKDYADTVDKESEGSFDEKVAVPDIVPFITAPSKYPDIDATLEEAAAVADTMSTEEVEECLRHIVDVHSKDPNFPARALELSRRYLFDEDIRDDPVKIEAAMVIVNSPYAEVRAVVDNHDDPNLPALTFRASVIGLIYVVIGAFLNQFFSIRQPGITISSNGKLFEQVLPTTKYNTFGYEWSFNPLEHMVATIMANCRYTAYVIWVQFAERFFNESWASNFGYQILISLSTNFIGYGLAGITRRFLVYPSYAIWPTNLATIALNRAFHSETNQVANGWKVSRMRFFLYAFGGMFVYFCAYTSYIFQALSYFNWMTWITPDNVLLGAVTGSIGGLGLNPIPTFDYNVLSVAGDPLINPFFTIANFFLGAIVTLPVWLTSYIDLPINSNGVFDNTGARYNVSMAVDEHSLFDEASYKAYSPAYLAAGNILLYGFFFATYAATISHTILYHRREIAMGFKSLWKRKPLKEDKFDIHSKLMGAYDEVPEWQYLCVLAVSVALGAVGVGAYPTSTTPAVVLYGILLAIIFCIPIGIIASITNVQVTLNVLAEFFGGLWFPGNANAMNFFKSYGYVTTAHTLAFAQDLKLAHYTHIPPKITFWVQMFATVASTFVCVGILNFQMTQIPDVCSSTQKDRFTCPGANTFFTASVLWGTLGPSRMFGSGAIYNPLIWCFLIGFVLPFIVYYLTPRIPIFKYFHLPVFLVGTLIWAPYNLSNTWPAVPIAYVFNIFIKKRFLSWWSKYNYILASAFTCAIALSAVIQFFAVQYVGAEINWGPNTIPYAGCDSNSCTYYTLADGEHFGPGVGEF